MVFRKVPTIPKNSALFPVVFAGKMRKFFFWSIQFLASFKPFFSGFFKLLEAIALLDEEPCPSFGWGSLFVKGHTSHFWHKMYQKCFCGSTSERFFASTKSKQRTLGFLGLHGRTPKPAQIPSRACCFWSVRWIFDKFWAVNNTKKLHFRSKAEKPRTRTVKPGFIFRMVFLWYFRQQDGRNFGAMCFSCCDKISNVENCSNINTAFSQGQLISTCETCVVSW